MKFCTIIWTPEVRTSALSVKMSTPLPLFYPIFTPVMHFQWEGRNWTAMMYMDWLWLLIVQTMHLGGGYTAHIKNCFAPIFPLKIKLGANWFSKGICLVRFGTLYISNRVMLYVMCNRDSSNGPPIGNHILWVEWSCDQWRHWPLTSCKREDNSIMLS